MAKTVAALNDAQTIAITDKLIEQPLPADETPTKTLIVFPCYAYGLPALVRKFLKVYPISDGYLAVCVTFGTKYGGTLNEAKKIMAARGRAIDYFCGIHTVENFIPIFGAQADKKVQARLNEQSLRSTRLAQAYQAELHNRLVGHHPIGACVSGIFRVARPLVSKMIKVTHQRCTRCGLCIKTCPAGAIVLTPINRIKICASVCNVCQNCLNVCPAHAINMARLHPSTPRYCHPQIQLSDKIIR